MAHARLISAGVVAAAACSSAQTVPNWEPTYDMQRSTIVQPCNMSGFLEPISFYAQFGIVDIDWSNAKSTWVQPPMSCEEQLVNQVAKIKAVSPDTRVFVYRNLVKALPWFSTISRAINDPSHSGWFLPFAPGVKPHVATCDNKWSPPRCSNLYHDDDQTPGFPHGDGSCPGPCDCGGVPCGEYLFDHRNASLRQFLVDSYVMGPTGLGNKNISGIYMDDGWFNVSEPVAPWMPQPLGFCSSGPIGGATEEDYHCVEDMGFKQADTTALTDAWRTTMAGVKEAVVGAGGWGWQWFNSQFTPSKASCASTMRSLCSAGDQSPWFSTAVMHEYTKDPKTGKIVPLVQFDMDLATFLLLRGPYAWLGYAWVGCGIDYEFPDALKADYGVPQGTCVESGGAGSGVFTRAWSKADVTVDCNAYTGTVTPVTRSPE